MWPQGRSASPVNPEGTSTLVAAIPLPAGTAMTSSAMFVLLWSDLQVIFLDEPTSPERAATRSTPPQPSRTSRLSMFKDIFSCRNVVVFIENGRLLIRAAQHYDHLPKFASFLVRPRG